MRTVMAILTAALLLGAASALEISGDASAAVLVSAEGSVVGVGEFEDGRLELELLAGFSGFATLTIVDESGSEVSAEVMVGSDGSVVLTSTLDELRDVVAESGAEMTVRTEERLEASVEAAFGAAVPDHVALPGVAVEGMTEAEARAAGARERAEGASSHEGEASAEAEARARAGGEASSRIGADRGDGRPDERSDERASESGGSARADTRGDASVGAGGGADEDGGGASAGAGADVSVGVGVGVGGGSER